MNKISILICFFALSIPVVNAQTFFSEQEEHIIYYSPDIAPTAVCVGDIELDGDQDILSFFNKKFRLYLHADGLGTFNEQELMDASDDWIFSVHQSDLNEDGRPDILAASYNNDKIIWYENEGALLFGSQLSLSDSVKGASSVYAADLDKDGDQDVLSASIWDNKIAWYENRGGGVFGDQQVITTLAEGARDVYVSDLNGDDLPDVLSASMYDHKIAWYENLGGGSFGDQQIISDSAYRALCVYSADLDGDGHLDVLSASAWDEKIAWYKNDGQGIFGVQQVISNSLKSAQSVVAADLDLDGDLDVISASLLDNKISWFENQGAGDFGIQRVVSSSADGPGFVYATDMDGDGYTDIVSASTDFKIAWHENTLPMNILANPLDTTVLPGSNAGFTIQVESVTAYQWQCNGGENFYDLSNNDLYSGVHTDRLELTGAGFDLQGNEYRCLVMNGQDSLHSLAAVLTIRDTIRPVISSVHPDYLLPANWNCLAEIPDYRDSIVATDNSYSTLEITQTPVPWSRVSGSGVEITLSASDGAGNSSQVSFRVDVEDLTPPFFNNMAGVYILEADEGEQFILPDFRDSVVVTDNCSEKSGILISQEPPPDYVIPDSAMEVGVILTATDEAGNQEVLSISAIGGDRVPPQITSIHEDVEIEGRFCYGYLPNFTAEVEASDNFDSYSDLRIEQSPEPYSLISGVDNIVTLTVTDRAGNRSEASFKVTVQDDQLPVIGCAQDQSLVIEKGQLAYTVSGTEFDLLSVEDNCEIASIKNNLNDSATLHQVAFPLGTTEVIWTVTDLGGNTTQCSFKVIVSDALGIDSFHPYGISLYPNPSTGDLYFESLVPVQRIRVLDLKGSIVLDRSETGRQGYINMAPYERGPYVVSIQTEAGDYHMSIVKE